jgi:UDP-N-acetylmuramyl pentapeptide phosphotransferase/UDP-N-acetylglucosamine-1-phosphate transferase
VLTIARNPKVSPLFPLLLCAYPIFETMFSIYRKKVLRNMSAGLPDGVHLHMLVYKRLMRWVVGGTAAQELLSRNSMTSPYLWLLCSLSVIPALLWWDNTPVLSGFIVLFMASYITLYWRIVRFKSPRWLVVRR